MSKDKLKYVMITNHIHNQLLEEDLARTGLYQWINVFEGDIKYPSDIKDYNQYDIVHINLSAQDFNLINTIKEKLDKDNTHTKIVANNDYTTELWQPSFEYPETMRRELQGADMLFGTEKYQVSTLSELTHRKVFVNPHPSDVRRLKAVANRKLMKDKIGVIYHRYDNFSYIPYFAVRNHGLDTALLGFEPNADPKRHVTSTLYKEVAQGTNYQEFCNQMMECRILVEPFTLHSYGRSTVDAAALGIPVVGSDRVESMRRCYPYTICDPFDTTKMRELITKVLIDPEFEKLVIETAKKNVEYYNHENSKKRFLDALEGKQNEEEIK